MEVIEEVPVKLCRRRGSPIDLVLDRDANHRSRFVERKTTDHLRTDLSSGR